MQMKLGYYFKLYSFDKRGYFEISVLELQLTVIRHI